MSSILVERKKKTKVKTYHSPPRTLSKPALIAIVVVVVAVIITAIIIFFIMRRRQKARAKHRQTLPGYSTDSSSGLYSQTPGYVAGHGAGGHMQENPPAGGAAAEYYAESQYAQGGGGGQGQGYGMPQHPARAFQGV